MFRTRYARVLLNAAEGDALPAGGSNPPTPPAAAPPTQTSLSVVDPDLNSPAVKAAIEVARREAAKAAREETMAKAKKEAEEEKRLAALAAEDRAREEAKKAQKDADDARAEAAALRRELEVERTLGTLALKPQSDEAGSLAVSLAQKLVDGGSSWSDALAQVSAQHGYLFSKAGSQGQAAAQTQQQQATAPAAQRPASTPATLAAARTAHVGPAAAPASDSAQPQKRDAFTMKDDDWKASLERVMNGGAP